MQNVSDIVEENGKTWKQNNMDIFHRIPLGTLVEIDCDYHAEHLMRFYVVKHTRDCDGSPSYKLGTKRESYVSYEFDSRDHGCWGEESLIIVPLNATSICPYCGHNNGDYKSHMGNDWIGTDTCQSCHKEYAYKQIQTTRYVTWQAHCITSGKHEFVIKSQQNDTTGPGRHILKFNVLECINCGQTQTEQRPDIVPGDNVKLLRDVVDEGICIAQVGHRFKVKDIKRCEYVADDYILVDPSGFSIKVPRVYFMEINFEDLPR